MKYAFIHRHRQVFSIQRMCQVIGVARSGYYAWQQRQGTSSPKRFVGDALQMKRKMPEGVIVHSDRGSQYSSTLYQSLLTRYELKCSMSAKGNCYDNACAESFFHSLKVEAIHGEQFKTRSDRGVRCLNTLNSTTTSNGGTVL